MRTNIRTICAVAVTAMLTLATISQAAATQASSTPEASSPSTHIEAQEENPATKKKRTPPSVSPQSNPSFERKSPTPACVPSGPAMWGSVTWSITDDGVATDGSKVCTLHLSGGSSPDIHPSDEVYDIPWQKNSDPGEGVTSIVIDGPLSVTSSHDFGYNKSGLFFKMDSVRSLTFSGSGSLKSEGKAAEYMFYDMRSLTDLDASKIDVSASTDMRDMFTGDVHLTSLNLKNWNTSRVTSMEEMFQFDSSLTALDIHGWHTGNVTNMNSTFYSVSSLTSLDLSNWDTHSLKTIRGIFSTGHDDDKLTSLNLSGWDTSHVTDMLDAFNNRRQLVSLDLSGWDTPNVTNMQGIFAENLSLQTLSGIGSWDTSDVTDMSRAFAGLFCITSLPVANWNVHNVKAMNSMFDRDYDLGALPISGWKTGNVTNMRDMFDSTRSLTTLDIGQWNTNNVTDMSYMFANSGVTTLDVHNWKTGKVTNMSYMFYETKLETLDASGWDTSSVTDMSDMFGVDFYPTRHLGNLKNLNASSWDTRNVTNMYKMFMNLPFFNNLTVGPYTRFRSEAFQYFTLSAPLSWLHLSDGNGTTITPGSEGFAVGNSSDLVTRINQGGTASAGVYRNAQPARLTFDPNGGSGGYITTTQEGQLLEIPDFTRVSKPSDQAVSWNTEADGSGTEYHPGDTLYVLEPMTFYVQWSSRAVKPVVSFDHAQFSVGQDVSGAVLDHQGGQPEAGDTVTVTWPDHTTSETTTGSDGKWSIAGSEAQTHGTGDITAKAKNANGDYSASVPAKIVAAQGAGGVSALPLTGSTLTAIGIPGILLALSLVAVAIALRKRLITKWNRRT
ncbi:BspA family leucine-rich repeat surface protein [Bifidobacterium sp. ESL0784]|uniref:BspA family leucine-rich repeat surface protein n=1 Tax=Bifidobacterium sp. ESL0784 TaxID=2983231 RepID=UPI0023F9F802|nr:BspA family leucine-rich repeat surface protein [Bifidobacterium sp. ESL0784]MDF7641208.1 BspA family leucine-rich repeat surface protein [Bifidobacterium sp. ESL0784]